MNKRDCLENDGDRPKKRIKLLGGAGTTGQDSNGQHTGKTPADIAREAWGKIFENANKSSKPKVNAKVLSVASSRNSQTSTAAPTKLASVSSSTGGQQAGNPPSSGIGKAIPTADPKQASQASRPGNTQPPHVTSGVTSFDPPGSSHAPRQDITARQSTGKRFEEGYLEHMPPEFKDFWMGSAIDGPNLLLRGIENPSQLCYRNAVVTALLNSPNFLHYLEGWLTRDDADYYRTKNTANILKFLHNLRFLGKNSRKADEFQDKAVSTWKRVGFVRSSMAGEDVCVRPWGADPACEGGGQAETSQQDAYSFLLWLYGTIREQLEVETDYLSPYYWDWVTQHRLVRHYSCPKCATYRMRSDTVHNAEVMNLSIPQRQPTDPSGPGRMLKLEELLANEMSTIVEIRCAICKADVEDTQVDKRFQHAPALLTLRLERGVAITNTRKDFSTILMPRSLDISDWLNPHQYGKGSKISYRLTAIIVHEGKNIKRGHYVTYSRADEAGDRWKKFDDSHDLNEHDLTDATHEQYINIMALADNDYATSYILIYDRAFKNDILKKGRAPNHVKDWDKQDDASEEQHVSVDAVNGDETDTQTTNPSVTPVLDIKNKSVAVSAVDASTPATVPQASGVDQPLGPASVDNLFSQILAKLSTNMQSAQQGAFPIPTVSKTTVGSVDITITPNSQSIGASGAGQAVSQALPPTQNTKPTQDLSGTAQAAGTDNVSITATTTSGQTPHAASGTEPQNTDATTTTLDPSTNTRRKPGTQTEAAVTSIQASTTQTSDTATVAAVTKAPVKPKPQADITPKPKVKKEYGTSDRVLRSHTAKVELKTASASQKASAPKTRTKTKVKAEKESNNKNNAKKKVKAKSEKGNAGVKKTKGPKKGGRKG